MLYQEGRVHLWMLDKDSWKPLLLSIDIEFIANLMKIPYQVLQVIHATA